MSNLIYIKLMLYTCYTLVAVTLDARGGGGFHGGGGGFHGGTAHAGAGHGYAGHGYAGHGYAGHGNYYHTNNFYGGRGYGGWGAWGAFGFTALTTTGIVLASSAAGNGNNQQLEQAFIETQLELEQLQKRLNELDTEQNTDENNTETEQIATDQKSPFDNPAMIKSYMEQLKQAQIDLKKAQQDQSKTALVSDTDQSQPIEQPLKKTEKTQDKKSKMTQLQNKLTDLKRQLTTYLNS